MKSLYFSATLRDSAAPVWRRFSVPMTYTFTQLHDCLLIPTENCMSSLLRIQKCVSLWVVISMKAICS